MRIPVALVLIAIAAPAQAADCPYLADTRTMAAREMNNGTIQIEYGERGSDGVDICTIRLARPNLVTCASGWEGPVLFASSTFGAHDSGVMVILDTVLYRRCD